MDDNVAGTYHLHTATGDEKTEVIAEHHEVVHRTTTGTVYVTRDGIELVPTPSADPNDPLVSSAGRPAKQRTQYHFLTLHRTGRYPGN